jgi:hypothetical protein
VMRLEGTQGAPRGLAVGPGRMSNSSQQEEEGQEESWGGSHASSLMARTRASSAGAW